MSYHVEITNCDDSCANALFRIEPPIVFTTEEARQDLGDVVMQLIGRRVAAELLSGATINFTHESADRLATQGYARIPALRYGSGKFILEQALYLALNGEY